MAPVKTEEEKSGLGIDFAGSGLPELSDDMPRAAEKEALGFILPAIPLNPFNT